MARIVNPSQQVIISTLFPRGVYSRVVSCVAQVVAGPGWTFAFTDTVAQNTWLLKVIARGFPAVPDAAKQTLFRIFTGTSKITTADDMLNWQEILPIRLGAATPATWTKFDGDGNFEWDMNQLFTGTGRRFGVRCQRGALGLDELSVSFQISEG